MIDGGGSNDIDVNDSDDIDFYRTAAYTDAPISEFPHKLGWVGAKTDRSLSGKGNGPTLNYYFSTDNLGHRHLNQSFYFCMRTAPSLSLFLDPKANKRKLLTTRAS